MRQSNLKWANWPLTVKLTLLITTLVVGVVLVITVLSLRREQRIFESELQRQLSVTLAALNPATFDALYFQDVDELASLLERLVREQDVYTFGRIYGADGRILADAFDPALSLDAKPDPVGQQLVQRDEVLFEPQPEQLLGGRAVVVGRQRLGAIQLGLSTAALEASQRAARNQGILVALSLALLGVGVAIFFSRNITRPVEELARASERVAAGDLSQRVTVHGQDELGRLREAFNQMVGQLQESLEDLTAQTRFLMASNEVSRQLSESLDPAQLSDNIVKQIQQSFGYYHVQIYQLDRASQILVLTAATGSAGAEMLKQRHSIPLSSGRSLVARAARGSQAVLVENVRQAPDWLPNPLLPDTQTEAAIPIIAQGKTVGVLDVQEDDLVRLTRESVAELSALADQIAVAILNSQRFAEVEQALAEAYQLQQRYTETTWDQATIKRRFRGEARYSHSEADELDERVRDRARRQAAQHETLTLLPVEKDDGQTESEIVVTPIKRQDVTIGNMQLYPLDADYLWTEDDLALVDAVVDQISQTAENLRLYEETRQRADYERLAGEITQKIRQAATLDLLAKAAAETLGDVLGVSDVIVRLNSGAKASPKKSGGNGQNGHS